MMMPVQQNQMIQNPMMQPQSPMGQMGQMSQPIGPQMMQPMMMQSAPPANYASGGAVMSNIAPMTSSTPVPAQ